MEDPATLERLPVTYQDISGYFGMSEEVNPFALRKETFLRIERVTGIPLICYVAKTHHLPRGLPAYIDDSDLTGFGDLTQSIRGDAVDVFVVSNGGSAEATERIVRLLRQRFKRVRFIVPANAYSAATLMCFSGNKILMDSLGTFGPIDPQIDGVPARAIQRAFERIEERLKNEGPRALTAYVPLLEEYDLHLLEMCRSAQELSQELALSWLSTYMLQCPKEAPCVTNIVEFFSDYDLHKSHARSIDRQKARELGLLVWNTEDTEGLANLVRSLCNQYELWFDKTTFYKVFENAYGINWGRQAEKVSLQVPIAIPAGVPRPVPQPGPPARSE